MIQSPLSGWSNLILREFVFSFSYIRNTPQELIDGFTNSLKNLSPCAILFDGEGTECLLTCTRFDCYTIINFSDNDNLDNSIETRRFDIDIKTLAKELIEDLENHEKEWSHWIFPDKPKKYDLSELKKLLKEKK